MLVKCSSLILERAASYLFLRTLESAAAGAFTFLENRPEVTSPFSGPPPSEFVDIRASGDENRAVDS